MAAIAVSGKRCTIFYQFVSLVFRNVERYYRLFTYYTWIKSRWNWQDISACLSAWCSTQVLVHGQSTLIFPLCTTCTTCTRQFVVQEKDRVACVDIFHDEPFLNSLTNSWNYRLTLQWLQKKVEKRFTVLKGQVFMSILQCADLIVEPFYSRLLDGSCTLLLLLLVLLFMQYYFVSLIKS